ncbi:MAG: hypothetical protein AMXMBFR13_37410 [Phycisphaerae bacterium]
MKPRHERISKRLLLDFSTVTSGVTLSRFAGHRVLANWSPDRTFAAHLSVAPQANSIRRYSKYARYPAVLGLQA